VAKGGSDGWRTVIPTGASGTKREYW